jgi:hypothetical protein
MRRSHKKRKNKRSRLYDAAILIGVSIIGLYLLAETYWVLFLWCLILVAIPTVSWLTYKLSTYLLEKERVRQTTEIVRDSRYISPQLRASVWQRCGGQCVECQSRSLLEYDHIIPISKGGATSYENLQILCRSCNRHKSDHI